MGDTVRMPQPGPPPSGTGRGDGWTSARIAVLIAVGVLALLVGVLGGFLIGDSSSTGGTTVISNATKENHTVTVTQPPTTVTIIQSETTTVTVTEPAT
jgi:hypothetical protein